MYALCLSFMIFRIILFEKVYIKNEQKKVTLKNRKLSNKDMIDQIPHEV